MRTCSQCGQTYTDDMSFCLADGTPLVPDQLAPDEPTVVRAPQKKDTIKTSTILLFILAGILTLTLGATIGVLYVFWPRQTAVEKVGGSDALPTPAASLREATPTATPDKTATPQRTPSPAVSDPVEEPVAVEIEPEGDAATTRITFGRGRVNKTLSGSVNTARSYVLYARNGQNLTASLRSSDDCVEFEDGSSRLSYPTSNGDDVITVVNNCDSRANFTLNVAIR